MEKQTQGDEAHWTGCKVFTATMARDRDQLGEKVSAWRAENPRIYPVKTEVRQSSDNEFHAVTIAVFFRMLPA